MLKVTIEQVPNDYYTAKIKNKLLLMDNLEAEDTYNNLSSLHIPTFRLDFIIAVFCLTGKITFVANSRKVEITASQCFVMLSDCQIDSIAIEKGTKSFTIGTVKDFFPTDNNANLLFRIKDAVIDSAIIPLASELASNILQIYTLMKYEINNMRGPYTKEIVLKYIHILMYKVFEVVDAHKSAASSSLSPRNRQLFDQFRLLADLHYRTHHTIQFYADRLCVTPKYLSTVCKKVSGKNAGELIDSNIMLEASILLRQKSASIKEIAYHLGFATHTQFSRFFKHHQGTTPSEFINIDE